MTDSQALSPMSAWPDGETVECDECGRVALCRAFGTPDDLFEHLCRPCYMSGARQVRRCRDCRQLYPRHEDWTVFDHSTGLSVSGFCATCGPARAVLR